MSISIGHRAIFSALGHRRSFASHTAPAPVEKPQAPEATDAGQLTCSPWEGLYLEQARPETSAGNDASTNRQLDAFLANLMYGE